MAQFDSLAILVVLYKKSICDSITFTTILAQLPNMISSGFSPVLYIWNNSPEMSDCIENAKIKWFTGDNNTLPYIYNTVAKIAFRNFCDYFMIADDDTNFSTFNFHKLRESINYFKYEHQNWGIIVPQIYSRNSLISPGRRLLFKGKRCKEISAGLLHAKNRLVINSGIIVTARCYYSMTPFYNETLRYYGTDTDFCVRYQKCYEYLLVLDVKIDHSLSEDLVAEPISKIKFRWHDSLYAMQITFGGSNLFIKILLNIYIFYLKIKLFYKYRIVIK